ncbi:unnamed protein product [Dibothriocephalus latus]|uniref:Uncharacterized protein n=1 Tax=Dibothriocephalus latus TaxID=60516 RepID=A0A3P6PU79_DIBLA|nr:unnamed protein product [Dibothriocephalus latus]
MKKPTQEEEQSKVSPMSHYDEASRAAQQMLRKTPFSERYLVTPEQSTFARSDQKSEQVPVPRRQSAPQDAQRQPTHLPSVSATRRTSSEIDSRGK